MNILTYKRIDDQTFIIDSHGSIMIKSSKLNIAGELVLQAERKRIQLRPFEPDLDNANVGNFFIDK
jgi:hypothetical protein